MCVDIWLYESALLEKVKHTAMQLDNQTNMTKSCTEHKPMVNVV